MLNEPVGQRLEQARSTTVSVEMSRRKQLGTDLATTDLLRQKSTALLRVLARATSALSRSQGTSYHYRAEVLSLSQPDVARIGIFPASQKGEKQRPKEPLISGATINRPGGAQSPLNKYFYVRWVVSCQETDFLTAIHGVFTPGRYQVRLNATTFARAHARDAVAGPGVFLYTTAGLFQGPLELIQMPDAAEHLNLTGISRSFRHREVRSIPLVLQYRINTSYGEVSFDILPPEGDSLRFLTVISHYDLSNYIAVLYRETGASLCNEEERLLSLKAMLGGYAETASVGGDRWLP